MKLVNQINRKLNMFEGSKMGSAGGVVVKTLPADSSFPKDTVTVSIKIIKNVREGLVPSNLNKFANKIDDFIDKELD